jgi:hypothetical protein
VVCVATRYGWLRGLTNKSAKDVAFMLFMVILDAGVVPVIIQSDLGSEFVNEMITELLYLLGARQVFSMALHPKSQGIIERSHREIIKAFRMLIDGVLRARPSDWVRWLPMVEARWRQVTVAEGITPYACWHGFFGSTTLQGALQAVEQIPISLVSDVWVRHIVQASQELLLIMNRSLDDSALQRMEQHAKIVHPRKLEVGQLVMVEKAFFERGLAKLTPRCDGPFRVACLPDAWGAILADPVTGVEVFRGDRIAMDRICVFHYPADIELGADTGTKEQQQDIVIGNIVAWAESSNKVLRLGMVQQIMEQEGQVMIRTLKADDRSGPMARRQWRLTEIQATMGLDDIAVVALDGQLLLDGSNSAMIEQSSLEKLRTTGVYTGR